MRVLITGGAGFIGSHLTEYHLAKGDEVAIIDDLSTGSLNNIAAFCKHPHFQFIKADILGSQKLPQMILWAECIYHLAAVVGVFRVIQQPRRVFEVNLKGYLRLLNLILKSQTKPRLILASTSSVYGQSEQPLLKETDNLILSAPTEPLSSYALSKLSAESLSLAYCKNEQLPVTIIRIFNTIGPRQSGQYGMVVPRFIQQARENTTLTIYGDGEQKRSFCDVRDSVRALSGVAEREETIGQIINVGNDKEISIKELANLILRLAKSKASLEYKSYQEAYGVSLQDIKNRCPDLGKLKSYFDFKHQWTLEETIQDLLSNSKKTVIKY